MERNEISVHEAMVFNTLANTKAWMRNEDIAKSTGMPRRTVRSHTARLVNLGLVDLAEVFPAHRYRYSAKADKRNKAYLQRIQQAIDIFGLIKSEA